MITASDAQKAEAKKDIELEKQMKVPPSRRSYLISYIVFTIIYTLISGSPLHRVAIKMAIISLLIYAVDYVIYYYKTRKER